MPKFAWRNGVAVGLIVGIGLALLFAQITHQTQAPVERESQSVANGNGPGESASQKQGEEQNSFKYWARRLVSFEDTSAQWLMTLFSIIAAVLLWQTLRETRRLTIAQSRAYVYADSVTVQWISEFGKFEGTKRGDVFSLVMKVANSGQTPCKWFEFVGNIEVGQRTESGLNVLKTYAIKPMRWAGLQPGKDTTFQLINDDSLIAFHEAYKVKSGVFKVRGFIRFKTEYDEVREAPTAFFFDGHQLATAFLLASANEREQLRDWSIKMYRPAVEADKE